MQKRVSHYFAGPGIFILAVLGALLGIQPSVLAQKNSSGETAGIPWPGNGPFTETVGAIMQRENPHATEAIAAIHSRKSPRLQRGDAAGDQTFGPPVSQWPVTDT